MSAYKKSNYPTEEKGQDGPRNGMLGKAIWIFQNPNAAMSDSSQYHMKSCSEGKLQDGKNKPLF